jgi:hypothetical protein
MPRRESPTIKRLTIDLTPELHRSLKVGAAAHDVQMVDLVRYLVSELLADPKRFRQVADKARDTRPQRHA